jgi:alpha-mannosidase
MCTQCDQKAEDRDELILRLFNPSQSSACDATLSVNPAVKRCCETDMNERLMDHMKTKGLSGRSDRDSREPLAFFLPENR